MSVIDTSFPARFVVTQTQTQAPLGGGGTNDAAENVLRKHLNQALKGPGWQSIIKGISAGDGPNWDDAKLAFDQLFLSTASGNYLVKRASDVGQRNPAGVDLSDELFRKLAIISKTRKLTQEAILEVLEVFYGRDACRASMTAAGVSPYVLSDQDDLTLLLDEKQAVTVVFDQVNFQDIGNATALEVATVINRALKSSRSQAFAVDITDEGTGFQHVRLYSGSLGLSSSVRVTGGKAQTQLLFPTSIYETSGGSPFAVWNITLSPTTPGNVRFTETQVTTPFDLFLLQAGDLAYIYGAEFGASFNQGTFVVQDVNVSYTGSTKVQWFEITNPDGVAASSVAQTLFTDLMFFRPSRSTVYDHSRHVIVAQTMDQVDIIIPATTQIVSRTPPTAAYLKGREPLEVASLVRTDSTITIETTTPHGLEPGNQVFIDDMVPTETGPSTTAGTPSGDYSAGEADGSTDASIKSTTSEAHTFEGVYHKAIRLLGGELMIIGGQTQVDSMTIFRRTDLAIFEKVSESVLGNGGRQQDYRWVDFGGPPLAGLALWLRADKGVTLGSGTDMATWADQSSMHQDMTVIPAGKPQFVASGINGQPAVQFSPVGGIPAQQIGIATNLKQTNSSDFAEGVSRTITAVVYLQLDGFANSGGAVASFRQGSNTQQMFIAEAYGVSAGPNTRVYDTNGGYVRTYPTFIPALTPFVLQWQYDGATIRFFVDGVEKTLSSNAAPNADNSIHPGFFVGNSWEFSNTLLFPSTMRIGDLLVYDRILTTPESALLKSYLDGRYGI